jgi:catechol 2,3-dioxygenase-like lactoylglutathione lyase family enzyme
MVKTHGLTHIALAVQDAQRSSHFYQQVFGMVETYRGEFCPGEPYVFFSDPDGYEVEIWYEPTR